MFKYEKFKRKKQGAHLKTIIIIIIIIYVRNLIQSKNISQINY